MKNFTPPWREKAPLENSYRSIFKWGSPDEFKHPNSSLYNMMKELFNTSDDDFQKPVNSGDEKVHLLKKSKLPSSTIEYLAKICGKENVSVDGYSRVKYSSGKTMEEAENLRAGIIKNAADAVVHPRNKLEVKKIVEFCSKKKIPVYVFGGGSSVNFGLSQYKSGICLVMNTHMNRLLELNETNQTALVQPGMFGPDYEYNLNNAPVKLNTLRSYTCGHFPQSFEYSTVGGWIVTLGSGQQSSYYGDAYDIVLSQEYVTPVGSFKTLNYPATATGPKINDIMKGNEGSFGILVEVEMKIFRYMPQNRKNFSYIFPTWESAVIASREISQSEFGMPAVFRISDPEETDVAMKLYGIEGTIIDKGISLRGFKPMQRCLLIGQTEGEKHFSANVKKQIHKICKKNGAMYISGYPVTKWEHGRYKDPYMREDLHDYGIIIDTLESGVTWDKLHQVHESVREFIKARPQTVCMTHASHFYPQGTNLYWIFIGKFKNLAEYKKFQSGVIDAIYKNGGSLSHHHGVGKMIAPWMEKHLGNEQMNILRALKKHFDPKGIMNPGQLGL
jgi:alkyldihydroxyacetonephosphate synthase